MKLSQWHKGSVKPVHVGVYKVNNVYYSHWDGKSFSGCWGDILGAYEKRKFYKKYKRGCTDICKWRGIVKDKK